MFRLNPALHCSLMMPNVLLLLAEQIQYYWGRREYVYTEL